MALGADFVEVSAKEGEGVDDAFMNLAERVYKRQRGWGETQGDWGETHGDWVQISMSSVISLSDCTDDELEEEGVDLFVGKKRTKFKLTCFLM